jgi:hypothetical protein
MCIWTCTWCPYVEPLQQAYDTFLMDYYRGDHYERFLQEYYEYSSLKRKMHIIQINDIYLATRCGTHEEDVIEVTLRTKDPNIVTRLERFLLEDRRVISHQPEDGFVSYSEEFDRWVTGLFSNPETQHAFHVEDLVLRSAKESI